MMVSFSRNRIKSQGKCYAIYEKNMVNTLSALISDRQFWRSVDIK